MPFYPNLEPNHRVELDSEGYQVVHCPFITETTTWSPNAEEWEVDCLFCEYLHGDYKESPDHGDGDADG